MVMADEDGPEEDYPTEAKKGSSKSYNSYQDELAAIGFRHAYTCLTVGRLDAVGRCYPCSSKEPEQDCETRENTD
jgi:hypothetical protein